MQPLSEILMQRGFIHQTTAEKLSTVTDGEKRTVYLGIDPTADSIHVGNLASFMLLKHFFDAGHEIILLVGGGTGMIGDPKPDVERPLVSSVEIATRSQKLKQQAEKFFGGVVMMVNNHDWLAQLELIPFLRDVGKHFTVNNLIKKDALAARLKSKEGISYTEFAYPLLQAYDFWHLFKDSDCTVQIGGSDQWGNITAGVDLIRRKEDAEVFGITLPLIVDKATGKKFGKSEGNAVWLDPAKTTPFQFYQFWLNTSDESVEGHLKIFTTLPIAQIAEIVAAHATEKEKRNAQAKLAHEVTSMVHGVQLANAARRTSEILFGDISFSEVTPVERDLVLHTAPKTHVAIDMPLVDILVATNLATSKREAKQFITDGAISINGVVCQDPKIALSESMLIDGVGVLRRGKKSVAVIVA